MLFHNSTAFSRILIDKYATPTRYFQNQLIRFNYSTLADHDHFSPLSHILISSILRRSLPPSPPIFCQFHSIMATKSKPLITIVFLATLITIATSQSSNPFLNMPPPASVSNLPPPLPAGSGSGSGGSYNPYAPPALTYPPPLGILPNSPPLPFVYYPAPPPPDPILPYFPWYYKHAPPKPSTSSANVNETNLLMILLLLLLGLVLQ